MKTPHGAFAARAPSWTGETPTPAGSRRCSPSRRSRRGGASWDVTRVERELIADEEELWLAIELEGEPAGIVGWWQEDDPQYH